jgi:hypothetical protein
MVYKQIVYSVLRQQRNSVINFKFLIFGGKLYFLKNITKSYPKPNL